MHQLISPVRACAGVFVNRASHIVCYQYSDVYKSEKCACSSGIVVFGPVFECV